MFRCSEPDESRSILKRLSEADSRRRSVCARSRRPTVGISLRTDLGCSAEFGRTYDSVCSCAGAQRHARERPRNAAHHLRNRRGRLGSQRSPRPVPEWYDGGSLTNRGMYMSPWTGAKYLWAVAGNANGSGWISHERTFSHRAALAGRILVGRRSQSALGRTFVTYVIDQTKATIFGDMREASAEEPYTCRVCGNRRERRSYDLTRRSGCSRVRRRERRRAYLPVQLERSALVTLSVEFRGETHRRRLYAGELAEISIGAPRGSSIACRNTQRLKALAPSARTFAVPRLGRRRAARLDFHRRENGRTRAVALDRNCSARPRSANCSAHSNGIRRSIRSHSRLAQAAGRYGCDGPGFPDPRVTPTPRRSPPTPTPSPTPTPYFFPTATPSRAPYRRRSARRMRHRSSPGT